MYSDEKLLFYDLFIKSLIEKLRLLLYSSPCSYSCLSMFSLHLFLPKDLNQQLHKETPPYIHSLKKVLSLTFYAPLQLGHKPKSNTC